MNYFLELHSITDVFKILWFFNSVVSQSSKIFLELHFLYWKFFIQYVHFQRAGGSKAASSPAENYHLARRRTLQVVVSALLTECGFDSAEKAAVETLTEMMQSCMCESPQDVM